MLVEGVDNSDYEYVLWYSLDRRSALFKRMHSPNNMTIWKLSQEEVISEATLYKWRADALCFAKLQIGG